ncbi:hypothetical protein PHSY_007208 [Pseudozyma hubeiensis SY62]|uniref:Uncharacterized protein n=1 Tax=Pseudozyma hubeiensis (strain SY62) TaxID=1305764 RepID=R9PN90_PSEHS|nr:hypothetical protein PHSY_007208 [Pseudozyma hubeiensis SY62]GAC99605.1 hypothetical protein PHSY_007208 [Pseudozyma hubeiensis SY62]
MSFLNPARLVRRKSRVEAPAHDCVGYEANAVDAYRQEDRPLRTEDYCENFVNLVAIYLTYLIILTSAAVAIYFSLRGESSFLQTYDVQSYPNVVFAWNADPSGTALPPVSAADGGSATCSPAFSARSSYLRYSCTSVASDGRESLRFQLYSTDLATVTHTQWRDPRLKYSDIEVPTYFLTYYSSLDVASLTSKFGSYLTTSVNDLPTRTPVLASAAFTPSMTAGTATSTSASLQARQASATVSSAASAATTSARSITNPSASPSLRRIDYGSASISAVAAGTIVSAAPAPPPTTTTIRIYTAKLEQSHYIYFIVVAGLAALLVTPTTILISYNLSVATKKVFPPEDRAVQAAATALGAAITPAKAESEPRQATRSTVRANVGPERKRVNNHRRTSNHARTTTSPGGTSTAANGATAELPLFQLYGSMSAWREGMTTTTEAASTVDQIQAELPEVPPPAYQERDSGIATVTQLTSRAHEDEIEVASEPDDDSNSTSSITPPHVQPYSHNFRREQEASFQHRLRRRARGPFETRTDGKRLSLRLAWMILPSYAFLFFWDGIAFIFLPISELAAIGLAGDALLDLASFIRAGGCAGPLSTNDGVWDLQKQVCGALLGQYPNAYSRPRPALTLIRVGGDLLAILLALVVIFLAQLTFHIGLFRKSHLSERDGMDPNDTPGRYTGKTEWGYIAVCEKTGLLGSASKSITAVSRRLTEGMKFDTQGGKQVHVKIGKSSPTT